jgi:hypothetical protein
MANTSGHSKDDATNGQSKKGNTTEDEKRKELVNEILGFLTMGGLLLCAYLVARSVAHHNYILAATYLIVIFGLLVLGSALATDNFLFKTGPVKPRDDDERLKIAWLVRLAVVAGLGHGAILLYAIQYKNWQEARVASVVSVGFVAGGASWWAGALTGFIFGIPRRRRADDERKKNLPTNPQADVDEAKKSKSSLFEPSTSLEEISDWLTKIIVGVGLTQLTQLPAKLDALGLYIAYGLDPREPNKALGIGIFIYFLICGFFFGYLWARLDMPSAFGRAGMDRDDGREKHGNQEPSTGMPPLANPPGI